MAANGQYPGWLAQLVREYEEAKHHAFLISGEVQDYVLTDAVGEDGDTTAQLTLERYLAAVFAKRIVVVYDIDRGLIFPHGKADKEAFARRIGLLSGAAPAPAGGNAFAALRGAGGTSAQASAEIDLPTDPSEVMDYISKFVTSAPEDGGKLGAVILPYVETLIPNMEKSVMPFSYARELVRFQNLGRDFAGFNYSSGSGAILIGITRNIEEVHAEVRGASAQWGRIEIGLPTEAERLEYLSHLQAQRPHITLADGLTLEEIARRTPILSRINLEDLYLRAELEGQSLTRRMVLDRINQIVRAEFGDVLQLHEAEYGFDSVAGLTELKAYAQANVIDPIRDGNLRRLPKGILLMGPPGVGKTFVFKAIAKEAGLPALELKLSNLLGGIVGESEKKMRKALDAIRAAAPCMVFIDEAEQMAPRRDGGALGSVSSDSIRRGLQTDLMTFTGDPSTKGKVVFVYATNYVSQMDDAFIRPGRVDAKLPIFLPDAEARRVLLELRLRRQGHSIRPEVMADVSEELEGYTGAELDAIAEEAINLSQDRAKAEAKGWQAARVTAGDLRTAAANVNRTTRGIPAMTREALVNTDRVSFLPPEYRRLREQEAESIREELEAAPVVGAVKRERRSI